MEEEISNKGNRERVLRGVSGIVSVSGPDRVLRALHFRADLHLHRSLPLPLPLPLLVVAIVRAFLWTSVQ